MAEKVEFRQGIKEQLPSEKFVSGSFYLTTDSHELYFAKNAENLIYIGSPYYVGTQPPDNLHLLWIHTNSKKGGLKYYNGTSWVHVPVAFTAMPEETPVEPDEGENPEIPTEKPNINDFDLTKAIRIEANTSGTTWDAQEGGWYLVEVFGASGNGGYAASHHWYWHSEDYDDDGEPDETELYYSCATGGSGASGAYTCEIVKLEKADRISIVGGLVGSEIIAKINSSSLELICEPGGDGGNANHGCDTNINNHDAFPQGGIGGIGGNASGGSIAISGLNGNNGTADKFTTKYQRIISSSTNAVIADGTIGGAGGSIAEATSMNDIDGSKKRPPESGQNGYVRITKY